MSQTLDSSTRACFNLNMTRGQARNVARKLQTQGFHHIRIIEDFETGESSVEMLNRAWMRRVVETTDEATALIRSEGRS